MIKVQLGTKLKPLGIQRFSCAEGTKCRAILLDSEPRAKYVAFDDNLRCRVEVTQDMLLQGFNLKPSVIYLYLVCKPNTDLQGNIVGSDFTVEYIQLSENLNNEFAEAVAENDNFTSLTATKIKKTGDGGKDFSYLKVTPSTYDVQRKNPELWARIEELRQNTDYIDNCWRLIDAATTLTPAQYEARLKGGDNTNPAQRQLQAATEAIRKTPAIASAPAPTKQIEMQQAPDGFNEAFNEGNDFGGGESFGGGDDMWN